jgi:hypothetical protein
MTRYFEFEATAKRTPSQYEYFKKGDKEAYLYTIFRYGSGYFAVEDDDDTFDIKTVSENKNGIATKWLHSLNFDSDLQEDGAEAEGDEDFDKCAAYMHEVGFDWDEEPEDDDIELSDELLALMKENMCSSEMDILYALGYKEDRMEYHIEGPIKITEIDYEPD